MDRLEPVIDSLSSNWILYFHCQLLCMTLQLMLMFKDSEIPMALENTTYSRCKW